MQIKFYGHACILIEVNGVTAVTDPWFSKSGAFLSSWFQFPDNTDLDLKPIKNADYIILSHEHEDHFDRKFLKTISPHTKIIIPRYAEPHLLDELRETVKNDIVQVETRTTIRLGPQFTLTPLIQSVPVWDDCTLVFETPEGIVADVNDMKMMEEDRTWLKKRFPEVAYLFAQFSGANWHPHVYDYPREVKAKIASEKRRNKFYAVKKTFEEIGAGWLIPSAGPPCFLDPRHFEINFLEQSNFPTQKDFYNFAESEGFAEKVVILLPGDELAPQTYTLEQNKKKLEHLAFSRKKEYLEAYQKRRLDIIREELSRIPEPDESLLGSVEAHFKPLIASSLFFQQKIGGKLLLDITGRQSEKICVDFLNPSNPVRHPEAGDNFFYKKTVDGKFLNLALQRRISWEALFLSMRFGASRTPDIFNEYFMVFLKFADPQSFRRYEMWERQRRLEETFEMEYEGKKYRVQRFCPHAMADLSKGRVVNGTLVCPGHGWKFSLQDGCCLQNQSRIKLENVPEEKTREA